MDKKKRHQIAVILGLLIILAPIFISPLFVFTDYWSQYVFVTVFVCIGLPTIWYGVYGEKFKNRKKQPPKTMPISDGAKTGLAGVCIVFLSFFVGVISLYTGHNPTLIGLFFLLLFIGTIVMYIGSYMTRKEREKTCVTAVNIESKQNIFTN